MKISNIEELYVDHGHVYLKLNTYDPHLTGADVTDYLISISDDVEISISSSDSIIIDDKY